MEITAPTLKSCDKIPVKILLGNYCLLQPLALEQHAKSLYEAFQLDKQGVNWTHLPDGPFADFGEFSDWLGSAIQQPNSVFYAIILNTTQQVTGMVSFINITEQHGAAEIGWVHYSPLLQRTTAATETIFLMLRLAFDQMHYRRIEWKCDNNNARSKNAAKRYGFQYEGLFRQHWIMKNRNRDTAWFSIIDKEWPQLKSRYLQWLHPKNFTGDGKQIRTLHEIY